MKAYLDIIARANPEAVQEAVKMSKSTLTLEQVFVNVGLAAKWETNNSLKIAGNMLNRGTSPEIVSEDTGLPLAKVKALLKTTKLKQTA
jgi:hypothetical protein